MPTPMLTTVVKKTICKPADVVARQFADIAHHVSRRVHPELNYVVHEQRDGFSRFQQRVRLLGMLQVDEISLGRRPDGSVVQETLSGTNAGMRISSRFTPLGESATEVTVTVEVPAVGVKRLLAPLFNAAVRKTTEKALEEDRIDLEERGYPA